MVTKAFVEVTCKLKAICEWRFLCMFLYLSVLGCGYYISMCTCVMQSTPINSTKITEIEKKKLIQGLNNEENR